MLKYAEIIPYIRLPKSLGIFDYQIQKGQKVKAGTLVKTPFRNQNIIGIVVKVKNQTATSKKNLKSIVEVLELKPVSQKYVDLLLWFSDYYLVSPAVAFKTVFPKMVKQRKGIGYAICDMRYARAKLTKGEQSIVKKILAAKKTLLVDKPNPNLYCHLAEKVVKKNQQVIILYPEIELTNDLEKFYKKHFGNDLVVFHSHISDGQYFTNWQKVQTGQAKVIIGTRIAVFAPVKNLGLIIIDSSHDASYKQWDQNPRYHAVEVAEKLADLYKSKLVLSSLTPKVEKYYQVFKKNYILASICDMRYAIPASAQASAGKCEIVDMREEIKRQNYSVLSEKLLEQIKNTISAKKKVLLFSNRRGSFSYVMCRDCGYIPKCPHCQISYSYHFAQESDLICHHCLKKESLSPFCPQCHGSRFKYVGAGILKIAEKVKEQIKNVKVAVYEAEMQVVPKDFDILISTQAIFNEPDIKNVNLAGVLNIDSIINLPDFRSNERAWQIVNQLKSISKKLIIQTYNPDHFKLYDNFEKFYQDELENRKIFKYPPYSEMIKLIFQHHDNGVAENAAVSLVNILKKNKSQTIEILGPLPSYVAKVRGRFRWYVVLKIPKNISDKSKNEIMSQVPDNWIIDRNPDSLL